VSRRTGLAEGTARAMDLRYPERWAAMRREAPLRRNIQGFYPTGMPPVNFRRL